MILSDTKAHMTCDYEKCEANLSVDLALNATGTWAVKLPTGHGWQIAYNEGGVFVTRCPVHITRVMAIAQPGIDIAAGRGKKN